MTNKPFQLVDVFAEEPFTGNPVAVVFDSDDLSTDQMLQMTRWFNLSEMTFLVSPTDPAADYRVRIFTLAGELPFAGHPTLGTCHAWLRNGGQPKDATEIVQECNVGLVRIRRSDETLAFAAPPLIRTGEVEESKLEEIVQILGISRDDIVDAQWVNNGPGWVAVLLESAEKVLAVEPARYHPAQAFLGIVGAYPAGSPAAFELRAIFSNQFGGLMEDPVTGSLNASVAQWLFASGRAKTSYVASQGLRVGRRGVVRISQDADGEGQVWVGGKSLTLFEGNSSY